MATRSGVITGVGPRAETPDLSIELSDLRSEGPIAAGQHTRACLAYQVVVGAVPGRNAAQTIPQAWGERPQG